MKGLVSIAVMLFASCAHAQLVDEDFTWLTRRGTDDSGSITVNGRTFTERLPSPADSDFDLHTIENNRLVGFDLPIYQHVRPRWDFIVPLTDPFR